MESALKHDNHNHWWGTMNLMSRVRNYVAGSALVAALATPNYAQAPSDVARLDPKKVAAAPGGSYNPGGEEKVKADAYLAKLAELRRETGKRGRLKPSRIEEIVQDGFDQGSAPLRWLHYAEAHADNPAAVGKYVRRILDRGLKGKVEVAFDDTVYALELAGLTRDRRALPSVLKYATSNPLVASEALRVAYEIAGGNRKSVSSKKKALLQAYVTDPLRRSDPETKHTDTNLVLPMAALVLGKAWNWDGDIDRIVAAERRKLRKVKGSEGEHRRTVFEDKVAKLEAVMKESNIGPYDGGALGRFKRRVDKLLGTKGSSFDKLWKKVSVTGPGADDFRQFVATHPEAVGTLLVADQVTLKGHFHPQWVAAWAKAGNPSNIIIYRTHTDSGKVVMGYEGAGMREHELYHLLRWGFFRDNMQGGSNQRTEEMVAFREDAMRDHTSYNGVMKQYLRDMSREHWTKVTLDAKK